MKLINIIWLKLYSLYWIGSTVQAKDKKDPPGVIIGVQDHAVDFVMQEDHNLNARDRENAWDRMFPGWRRGVTLLVFRPIGARCCTKEQFIEALADRGELDKWSVEQINERWGAMRRNRVVAVPSVAMKKVRQKVYDAYWKPKLAEKASAGSSST